MPSLPPRLTATGGLTALIIGGIALGFAPIFVRLSEVGPSATAFWRLALALPVMLLWGLRASAPLPSLKCNRASGYGLTALAGACFAADLILWHRSIAFTTIANATLLTNLSVVIVPLMLWLLYRQSISGRFALAVSIALAGTVLLVGQNAQLSSETLRGDALAITSAVFYSGYMICIQAAQQRGIGTMAAMASSGLVATLVLFPVTLLSPENMMPQSAYGWWILAGLAGISHLGGQSLIAHALTRLPAAFVSLGLLLQPATAMLIAWLYLGESLSVAQMLGAAILIVGIRMAQRRL